MKIGIDARLWRQTGVGRYIRNLVWELQKIDKTNEYVLFAPSDVSTEELGIKENKKWKVVAVDIRWHSIAEQKEFPKILYKENLDLMHFPYFSLPIFYKKPFVVTIHDLIITHFPTGKASTLPLPLYYFKRFAYDHIVKHAIKKAKKIIVPLHAVKNDLMQTFNVPKEKIIVTEEGVSLPSSLRAEAKQSHNNSPSVKRLPRQSFFLPRNDGNYFLYVGNAYPHKNLERLIEAYLLFRKEVTEEVSLLLVGKDDYFYKRIEEKVKRKAYKGIIFKHDVNDTELSSLYKHAQAFISPSLMEGFGLPALEAMSVSCPVLVSDIPSFREVCQEGAFYFDPYSISDMKKKMQFVYNLDSKKLQLYKNRGSERVKDFSWKQMAEATKQVYESSIGI